MLMKTRVLYIILAVVVLAIVAFTLYYNKQETNLPQSVSSNVETTKPAEVVTNTSEPAPPQDTKTANTDNELTETPAEQSIYSDESGITAPDIVVHEITFSGTAYSPKTLTIKQGDIVVFTNNGSKDFWPASDNHPSHTVYPEFDAKSGIDAGKTFQFKFAKKGSWKFHDHLTPSATGTITVE